MCFLTGESDMTAQELINKLAETEGILSVQDGVLWFESGESVDLSKLADSNAPVKCVGNHG